MIKRKKAATLRKAIALMLLLILGCMVTGCGFASDGPFGWGMTHHTTPVAIGHASTGYKEGKACIYSFMGAISLGDAGIEAAMRDGGIKDVFTIDSYTQSFFGTYTRQCTIIIGS
ncbi:MAG: hypothetical protein HQL01_05605 [Nitrospirae bacterium]|nr:hypothetical protein [Nitrospirota bacterium]